MLTKPNYQLGKIYKLTGNGFIYYGSTCQPLEKRLSCHRNHHLCYLGGKYHYVTSFKCFENNNLDYVITLVENYPCNNQQELFTRERYFIENNECINKYIPTRTSEQYKEEHKNFYVCYGQEYRKKHKETLKQYADTKIKCECGCFASRRNYARHCKTKTHLKGCETKLDH